MVRGIVVFTKYFKQYPDNYVIIGGTACDIIVSESGFSAGRITQKKAGNL